MGARDLPIRILRTLDNILKNQTQCALFLKCFSNPLLWIGLVVLCYFPLTSFVSRVTAQTIFMRGGNRKPQTVEVNRPWKVTNLRPYSHDHLWVQDLSFIQNPHHSVLNKAIVGRFKTLVLKIKTTGSYNH